jgi:hypothetical protein
MTNLLNRAIDGVKIKTRKPEHREPTDGKNVRRI